MNKNWFLYICVLVILILYLVISVGTDYYGCAVAERCILVKSSDLIELIKILENKEPFKTYYTLLISIPCTKYETLLRINHHSKWRTEKECLEALQNEYEYVKAIDNWSYFY